MNRGFKITPVIETALWFVECHEYWKNFVVSSLCPVTVYRQKYELQATVQRALNDLKRVVEDFTNDK